MSRRRRRWKLWKSGLLCALLAIVLFMGVLPLVESIIPVSPQASLRLEWSRSRILEILIALWFFAFGSMVGSFINVVVWRMPRGVSVITNGSACPHCTAKIRLADNVPIIGWLKLGGRCRVCRLPISPRYPIIEAIFGVVFLLVFLAEVMSAGGNLPGGALHDPAGILPVVMTAHWDVIAIYAFHMTLVTLLLAWALMQRDGSRLPQQTMVFAVLVGFAGPAILPGLQPVKWMEGSESWLPGLAWLNRFDSGFAGLTAGFLLGEFLEQFGKGPSRLPPPGYLRAGLMSTGLFLGWQALATVVLMGGLASMALRCGPPCRWIRTVPPVGLLGLATLIQIGAWRWIDELVGGSTYRAGRFAAALTLGAVLLIVARGGATAGVGDTPTRDR